MTHIVLLGDSIFDNAAYVAGGPDVVRQLRARLGPGSEASLRAIDGDVTRGVARQLERIPAEATHLVVSVGGNDALRHTGAFQERAGTVGEALARVGGIVRGFAGDYDSMLDAVTARGLPTIVCTIYDPRFPDPLQRRLAILGLALCNDAILRAATARGVPVLDLRLVCDADEDFANPIEPSTKGGDKIAAAIARAVTEHSFGRRRTEVFAR
ncbi:SGNH/GDSL hydrolase family protein [Salinarimonas soli]|uniref:SGNH/GDSL hydrolase family protein n=1 Tax=Salinarimonas soli TaxID=1638099 RepID=A0A5B2VHZ5_9HYPH|nr:SGNH/GDSL hydrolase family protein [Salinarimonas soli]KAA2237972.1 SGNH/GDSL hydrolase family protein [Salinarimonas soli]